MFDRSERRDDGVCSRGNRHAETSDCPVGGCCHRCPAGSAAQTLPPNSASTVRTYYVAADEVEWDCAPGGVNKMMGMKFEGNSKVFTERGPHRIGTVYRKALDREYTENHRVTRSQRAARPSH